VEETGVPGENHQPVTNKKKVKTKEKNKNSDYMDSYF
jgi:hypothetical protein